MIFNETPIEGLLIVEPEPIADQRGLFVRTYSQGEFLARGLEVRVAECSTSFNARAGTLRGMHYQQHPHEEVKLVRCTRGAIYDVALDLREGSPTYLRWHAVELDEDNRRAFYIPAGCAHGFQTLRDGSEVLYQISVPYEAGAARGVRWNDPAFAIDWPEPPSGDRTMSPRDQALPDLER